jgi:hypothetical protein
MSFDELIGGDDLTPEEEARLRRVHDLLIEAGPPPELPRTLAEPAAAPDEAEILHFPVPRRLAVSLVAAAAMVIAGFGIGYFIGHAKTKPEAFAAERVVSMHGKSAGDIGVLRIAERDKVGNWPMELEVRGLPTQPRRSSSYELWLTKDGKAVASCGSFRVDAGETTVRLSVPYRFSDYDGWVVTAQPRSDDAPGPIVLTT